jgi:hypothetical protein
MNMICNVIGITSSVSFVDHEDKSHAPKQYWMNQPKIGLILKYEHYIPKFALDKYINVITNRAIKLSMLIATMIQKNEFFDCK